MIYKWVREYVEKYSFVTKVELKNSYVYIYYKKNSKQTWKRISFRANRDKLLNLIENIKSDIGYYEEFEKRKASGFYDDNANDDTPLIFANR